MNSSKLEEENKALKKNLQIVVNYLQEVTSVLRKAPVILHQFIPDVPHPNQSHENVFHPYLCQNGPRNCMNLHNNFEATMQHQHLFNMGNHVGHANVMPTPLCCASNMPTITVPMSSVNSNPIICSSRVPEIDNFITPASNNNGNRVYKEKPANFAEHRRARSSTTSNVPDNGHVGQLFTTFPPIVHNDQMKQHMRSSKTRKRSNTEINVKKKNPVEFHKSFPPISGWKMDNQSVILGRNADILEEDFDSCPSEASLSVSNRCRSFLLTKERRIEEGEVDQSPDTSELLTRARIELEAQLAAEKNNPEFDIENRVENAVSEDANKNEMIQKEISTMKSENNDVQMIPAISNNSAKDDDVVYVGVLTAEEKQRHSKREQSVCVVAIKKRRILCVKNEADFECDISSSQSSSNESPRCEFSSNTSGNFHSNVPRLSNIQNSGNAPNSSSDASADESEPGKKRKTNHGRKKGIPRGSGYSFLKNAKSKDEVKKMAEKEYLMWHYTNLDDYVVYFRCRNHQQCRLRWRVSMNDDGTFTIEQRSNQHHCR